VVFFNPVTGIPTGTSFFGAFRDKRLGLTVGGGVEWAFASNWTAKAEFLYLDFGSFNYLSPLQGIVFPASPPFSGTPT